MNKIRDWLADYFASIEGNEDQQAARSVCEAEELPPAPAPMTVPDALKPPGSLP